MLWTLRREYRSLGGVVDFHDTGKTFEAEADQVHAVLVDMQSRDGCCYSAEPAKAGAGAAVARSLMRMAAGVRLLT